jgi:tetratricopeptide (TPR) repeat protein
MSGEATTPGGGPPASAAPIVEPKVNEGELRMDGKVSMIVSNSSFRIDVMSFTTAAGKTVPLTEAKTKLITSDDKTTFYARGAADQKLAFSEVKLGTRVTIVGKDLGSGKALPAREVMLWVNREREGKTLGVVRVNAEVGKLIDRGDEAKQIRDYNSALRFYNRAVELAVGAGDRAGQGLAISRAGGIYADLEQYDQAITSYNRAIGLWRASGNSDSEATALNNLGLIYSRQDDNEKAIESLERAANLLQNSANRQAVVLTWNNLAGAYVEGKQYDKALGVYERLLPMVHGRADRGEEAEVLSDLAYLHSRARDAEKSQEYMKQATPLLDSIGEREIKARVTYTLGIAAHNNGATEEALAFYNQALTLFGEVGDKQRVESINKAIAALRDGGDQGDGEQQDNAEE